MRISGFSEMLKQFYTDRLDVSRFVEVINPDGTQGVALSASPIYENVPCKISFTGKDNPEGATEATNPENLTLKLFCDVNVNIQKGDKLSATRMSDDGVTVLKVYKGTANLPAVYVTHQEVIIAQVGDA